MATITLIPGDGIGPEVTTAARLVVEAAGAQVDWEPVLAGARALEELGTPLPQETLASIASNGVALKGPLTTPIAGGFTSINVTLRQKLDLYCNFRPAKSLPGVFSKYKNLDILVVRENTECLYQGIEFSTGPAAAAAVRVITRENSTRIARFAFQYALETGRKKVTAVHKANILKQTDGLFLDCCRLTASQFPQIAYEEVIIDNLCLQLVIAPQQYDILLLPNFYGDIVSDLCSGLVGGLGVVPGVNFGEKASIFEAVHGTAPTLAGKGQANPTAIILSAAMLLEHIGEKEAAAKVKGGLFEVLAGRKCLTQDLGGTASTSQFTEAVCQAVSKGPLP